MISHRHSDLRAPEDASVREIQQALARNRQALDETIRRLRNRFSAGDIVESGLSYFQSGAGAEYARNLKESVVRNPIPITLTAIGLTWLMAEGRSGGVPHGEGATGHTAEQLKGAAGTIGSRVRDAAARAGGAAGGASRAVYARTREGLSQAPNAVRNHPFLVAGAGLAVGAVLAAIIPASRTEGRIMGPARRRAMERMKAEGERLKDRVKESVKSGLHAAGEEAKRQGVAKENLEESGRQAGEKAERIMEAAREQAAETYREQDPNRP